MQRSVEYVLLASIFFFFLLAFFGAYRLSIAIALFVLFFGMNLRLTGLREIRRMHGGSRSSVTADAVESILFLLLLLVFSIPSITTGLLGLSNEEHYALIAAVLFGIFMGGLSGELWFQLRTLRELSAEDQVAYMRHLRRTIVLPYLRK